jgi:hypothetical protein
MIAITICATEKYQYAMESQASRVAAACRYAKEIPTIILVGDRSIDRFYKVYRELIPEATVSIQFIDSPDGMGKAWNYKVDAQRLIAKMRGMAFDTARAHDADFCWSLDSDVLPAVNSLRVSLDVLNMDGGRLYGVAACPYPSQGGGLFLCGRGDSRNPIFPDFKEAEKKEHMGLWESNQKNGWRRRGWFDFAYPGIGWGAVVPSDWCGFGATLMNRDALATADFAGYDGRGTEDLYVNFRCWLPAGIRIAAIPHCPAAHVIRRDEPIGAMVMGHPTFWDMDRNKLYIVQPYHEERGEEVGHLRVRMSDWRNG